MTGPRLSICIATYNRAGYIGQTLESIIPQAAAREIEILIVDGASTDDTAAVVKKYSDRCPQIRYVRLPSKGGVDHDYNQAVELARGQYCWLFTDDDLIKPGAVQTVLDQIQTGCQLIIVNAEVRDADLSVLLKEKHLAVSENRIYTPDDFENFFLDVAVYLSFIGCVVIKRSVWTEREKRQYYGTEFVHLGVIFQRKFESPISVIAAPCISIRLGNAQWSSRVFEIWMLKWTKIIWMCEAVSDRAKANVAPKEPWRKLGRLSFLRAEGKFGLEEYRRFLLPRISSWHERALIRCLLILPGRLLNFLAFFYYSLRSPDNALIFFGLKNSKHYWRRPSR